MRLYFCKSCKQKVADEYKCDFCGSTEIKKTSGYYLEKLLKPFLKNGFDHYKKLKFARLICSAIIIIFVILGVAIIVSTSHIEPVPGEVYTVFYVFGDEVFRVRRNFEPMLPPEPSQPTYHNITLNTPYLDRGSVSVRPSSASKGSPITLFAEPRHGYEFYFWESHSEYIVIENLYLANASFLIGNHDVAISAHFRPRLFDIIIDVSDSGFGDAGSRVEQASHGERVEIFAYANEEYEFYRWRVLQGGVTVGDPYSNSTFFIMPSSNVVVVAVFKEPTPVPPTPTPPTPAPAPPTPAPAPPTPAPPTPESPPPTPESTPTPTPGRDQF